MDFYGCFSYIECLTLMLKLLMGRRRSGSQSMFETFCLRNKKNDFSSSLTVNSICKLCQL